jgi:hypothetical protein
VLPRKHFNFISSFVPSPSLSQHPPPQAINAAKTPFPINPSLLGLLLLHSCPPLARELTRRLNSQRPTKYDPSEGYSLLLDVCPPPPWTTAIWAKLSTKRPSSSSLVSNEKRNSPTMTLTSVPRKSSAKTAVNPRLTPHLQPLVVRLIRVPHDRWHSRSCRFCLQYLCSGSPLETTSCPSWKHYGCAIRC